VGRKSEGSVSQETVHPGWLVVQLAHLPTWCCIQKPSIESGERGYILFLPLTHHRDVMHVRYLGMAWLLASTTAVVTWAAITSQDLEVRAHHAERQCTFEDTEGQGPS
jgi:hypothetical protein